MKVVIIIPTYQEKDNITKLIAKINQSLINLKHKVEILVVDDDSPDKTGKKVKQLILKFDNLHLLSGSKQGLGNAYIRGMKYAMEILKADLVIQMDADFSHAPSDIPRLTAQIDQGFDVVIGSRYIQGGQINNWSLFRRVLSSLGNNVIRNFLGLKQIKDCTAGFRAIRVSLLKKLQFDQAKVEGYGFQVWLLYNLFINKSKIKEIPVNFVDRKIGKTKLGFWDIIEGIITLFRIKKA